jgi:hypothetical protein
VSVDTKEMREIASSWGASADAEWLLRAAADELDELRATNTLLEALFADAELPTRPRSGQTEGT